MTMMTTRLRGLAVVLIAVGAPPAVVWIGSAIAHASKVPPPAEKRVERFADYFPARTASSYPSLGKGAPIWVGHPGEGAAFFHSMVLSQNSVVLLSTSRFVAVDTRTQKVARDISVADDETLAALGATALAAATTPQRIWLYSWQSGDFGLYDFSEHLSRVDYARLQPSLRTLKWVGENVVASGPFESELVRLYSPGRATHSAASSDPRSANQAQVASRMQPVATIGRPLFPGIIAPFAKSLNMTSVDVTPDGERMAVAYQWSDKIDVYDLSRRALERSIAGPVESKLDFAVAKLPDKTIFTLSDESQFSYVDVAVTDDAILGLYAGRDKRKYGMSFANGEQIHVFTWDGRLRGVWQLQNPLQQIEVNPETETLYGLRWGPATVVAFDIAPLLNAARDVEHRTARQTAR